jgi:hypothetical protein
MQHSNTSALKTISVVLIMFVLGCGGGQSGRQPVFGSVSGADDRQGFISFVPAGGNHSPTARCRIRDNHYQFTKDDGPLPGRYQVLIQLERDRDAIGDGNVVVKEVSIPREAAGEMSAELEIMPPLSAIVPDVSDGNSLQIDFQFVSQPPAP